MADVMVPSLDRSEYMYELREIAANISRELCKHAEVDLGLHTGGADSCKVPDATDGAETPVEPRVADDSPSQPADVHVGPAFHIPMTQEKTLLDLPSQLDFEWQESASQGAGIAPNTARSLGEELHIAITPLNVVLPVHVEVDTFVQVSQIAHEVLMNATEQPCSTIATNTAEASNV
jgi:hypothetical protein